MSVADGVAPLVVFDERVGFEFREMSVNEFRLDSLGVPRWHRIDRDVSFPGGDLDGKVVGSYLFVLAQIVKDVSPSPVRKRPEDSAEK